MVWSLAKKTGFYALVVFIVVVAVFPFYYAILTSFKSGTDLFRVTYWPTSLSFANYLSVLNSGSFPQHLLNSVFVAGVTVLLALFLAVTASFALSRVRFRGRGLLLMTILAVDIEGLGKHTTHLSISYCRELNWHAMFDLLPNLMSLDIRFCSMA